MVIAVVKNSKKTNLTCVSVVLSMNIQRLNFYDNCGNVFLLKLTLNTQFFAHICGHLTQKQVHVQHNVITECSPIFLSINKSFKISTDIKNSYNCKMYYVY